MSSDNWWENISAYESDYVPRSYTPTSEVEANHNLLNGLRENEFDSKDSSYTYGLLTLALVFLISGAVACFLFPFLYTRFVRKSMKERIEERLRFGRRSHIEGNLLMVLASVAAVACASGVIWGFQRADSVMTKIAAGTQGITSDVVAVLSLPTDTADALDGVSTSYDALLGGVENCTNNAAEQVTSILDSFLGNSTLDIIGISDVVGDIFDALDETSDEVDSLVESVQDEVDEFNEAVLNQLADDVQGVTDAIDTTEGIRKGLVWPIISLSMLMIAIFVAIALGTYECVAWDINHCDCIGCFVSPCTIFLAVIIWITTVAAVSLSALSGDFCIDPDSNAQTLVLDDSEEDLSTTEEELLAEIVTYYTGGCATDNSISDLLITSQEVAIPFIKAILSTTNGISDSLISAGCDVSSFVDELDLTLRDLWTVLENATELTSCENINGQYQSVVYDDFCDNLPRGLLGFWVSGVILTVLLLTLAALWNRMLRQKTADEEGDVVEARENWSLKGMVKSFRWSGRNAKERSEYMSGVRPVESATPQNTSRWRY